MKEELIKKLESQKLAKAEDWHTISEREANRIKNFNAGIQVAIELIQKEM